MRIEFYDHTAGIPLLTVESPNTAFVSNVFNLFMAEMVNLHGPSFKKITDNVNNGVIALIYTHNITGVIDPQGA